jgi:hypothetical protein
MVNGERCMVDTIEQSEVDGTRGFDQGTETGVLWPLVDNIDQNFCYR